MQDNPEQSRAFTAWITGLPGAGKSDLAAALAAGVQARGWPVEVLDEGALRQTPWSQDLGFSRLERDADAFRLALLAQLLNKHGVVVIVAAVSPDRETRDRVRAQVGEFVEIYASTPAAHCVDRGSAAWRAALAGEIRGFPGVDEPYEPPLYPEVEADLSQFSPPAAAADALRYLERAGRLLPPLEGDTRQELLRAKLKVLGYS